MKVEQIYTTCLSQGAYYIESAGEVAVIDPLREVAPYIEKATKEGASIKYIFETHFHADFVSGHVTLANKTGATIVYGPSAKTGFEAYISKDGEEFTVGNLTIQVLHTPGHTLESTTYLLLDEEGNDYAIFTGDTLFLGDVGRPDLAQKNLGITQEELAGLLYDSLRMKIMPLADEVIVYPGHGAGSACGKNMMRETVDTLGNQKRVNYALRDDMTREEFIVELTEGLLSPPAYFPANVHLNKEGYAGIDLILANGTKSLDVTTFEWIVEAMGALILDVRKPEDFALGHIPNSLFIGLDGSFAPWVGELVKDIHQPIVLVVEAGREEEAVTRLARVGFDQTLGYLVGGINAWIQAGKEVEQVTSVEASILTHACQEEDCLILDVRKEREYASEHVVKSWNVPLRKLANHLSVFPVAQHFYLHCAGGYRSMIAASILKVSGIHGFVDVKGGYKAIKQIGVPCTEYVCPSLL